MIKLHSFINTSALEIELKKLDMPYTSIHMHMYPVNEYIDYIKNMREGYLPHMYDTWEEGEFIKNFYNSNVTGNLVIRVPYDLAELFHEEKFNILCGRNKFYHYRHLNKVNLPIKIEPACSFKDPLNITGGYWCFETLTVIKVGLDAFEVKLKSIVLQ